MGVWDKTRWELDSHWICWKLIPNYNGFVWTIYVLWFIELICVWFKLWPDLKWYCYVFLIGDFFKLSLWRSGSLAHFVAHCEYCMQYRKIVVLNIRVFYCFFVGKMSCRILYFSLRIVKSLQFRERR